MALWRNWGQGGTKCCEVGETVIESQVRWIVVRGQAERPVPKGQVVIMEEGKQTVDLNGEFRFKIDAKGRMSLPAKFRKLLSSDLTVTRNLESECLYVFDDGEFNEWVNQLFVDRFDGYNSANPAHVKLRRKLKSRANDVQLDSAGRITLSAEMRSEVGIGKEVVIVGNTGYFEVWDAKRYDEMDAEVDLLEMLRIHD